MQIRVVRRYATVIGLGSRRLATERLNEEQGGCRASALTRGNYPNVVPRPDPAPLVVLEILKGEHVIIFILFKVYLGVIA